MPFVCHRTVSMAVVNQDKFGTVHVMNVHHVGQVGLNQTRGIINVFLKAAEKVRRCRSMLGRVVLPANSVCFAVQIVKLTKPPQGLGEPKEAAVILKQGVDAELLGVPGSPTEQGEKIVDPLTEHNYDLRFVGIQGEEVTTGVVVQKKIWFDGELLNMQ